MRLTLQDRDPLGVQVHIVWYKGIESLIAGAGAGLASAVITCPLDVIKTKLQAGGGGIALQNQGIRSTFSKIWASDGFRGLYRGLGPTIFGYLPTWAIYFTVYDKVKAHMGALRGHDDPISHITAAMSAGAIGTIATNPLWVIKTRFMTQETLPGEKRYRHTFDAIIRIYRTEGVRAFYRGLVPSLIGVSHIGVQFPMYEQLKVYYRPTDGTDIPSSTILFCSSSSKMIASVATYPHEVLRTRLQIQKHARSAASGSKSTLSQSSHAAANASHLSQLPVRILSSVAGAGAAADTTAIPPYEGIYSTYKKILREEGYRGFYRGMGVNLLRTVPSSAMTILTYEVMIRKLTALSHPQD